MTTIDKEYVKEILNQYADVAMEVSAIKREIIKEKDSLLRLWRILAGIGYGILIVLLILEVTNPSLGWVRF